MKRSHWTRGCLSFISSSKSILGGHLHCGFPPEQNSSSRTRLVYFEIVDRSSDCLSKRDLLFWLASAPDSKKAKHRHKINNNDVISTKPSAGISIKKRRKSKRLTANKQLGGRYNCQEVRTAKSVDGYVICPEIHNQDPTTWRGWSSEP